MSTPLLSEVETDDAHSRQFVITCPAFWNEGGIRAALAGALPKAGDPNPKFTNLLAGEPVFANPSAGSWSITVPYNALAATTATKQ